MSSEELVLFLFVKAIATFVVDQKWFLLIDDYFHQRLVLR